MVPLWVKQARALRSFQRPRSPELALLNPGLLPPLGRMALPVLPSGNSKLAVAEDDEHVAIPLTCCSLLPETLNPEPPPPPRAQKHKD